MVRAIDIVRIALETFGAPIYVRKEIVHNRYVVDELTAKGAIFVDSVDEVPPASGSSTAPTALPRRCARPASCASCGLSTLPARW